MKRITSSSSVFLALTVAMLFASGCLTRIFSDGDDNSSSPHVQVEPNVEFEVALGETVELKDTNIELTFAFVSGDSRCPADVTCIWQGEASILIAVNGRGLVGYQVSATLPGLIQTPYYENPPIDVDGYQLRFLRLNPYPKDQVPTDKKDYKALFVVEL